jgi:hypothetical protein
MRCNHVFYQDTCLFCDYSIIVAMAFLLMAISKAYEMRTFILMITKLQLQYEFINRQL